MVVLVNGPATCKQKVTCRGAHNSRGSNQPRRDVITDGKSRLATRLKNYNYCRTRIAAQLVELTFPAASVARTQRLYVPVRLGRHDIEYPLLTEAWTARLSTVAFPREMRTITFAPCVSPRTS
jgi:hypothetical protein